MRCNQTSAASKILRIRRLSDVREPQVCLKYLPRCPSRAARLQLLGSNRNKDFAGFCPTTETPVTTPRGCKHHTGRTRRLLPRLSSCTPVQTFSKQQGINRRVGDLGHEWSKYATALADARKQTARRPLDLFWHQPALPEPLRSPQLCSWMRSCYRSPENITVLHPQAAAVLAYASVTHAHTRADTHNHAAAELLLYADVFLSGLSAVVANNIQGKLW